MSYPLGFLATENSPFPSKALFLSLMMVTVAQWYYRNNLCLQRKEVTRDPSMGGQLVMSVFVLSINPFKPLHRPHALLVLPVFRSTAAKTCTYTSDRSKRYIWCTFPHPDSPTQGEIRQAAERSHSDPHRRFYTGDNARVRRVWYSD
jgi:hypothetical protein